MTVAWTKFKLDNLSELYYSGSRMKLKAKDFLRVVLSDGRLPAGVCTTLAEPFEITAKDLEAAAKELRCEETHAAFDGPMCWGLNKA